jgi:hypothetical protein
LRQPLVWFQPLGLGPLRELVLLSGGGGGWRQVRAVGCLLEDLLTTTTCKRAVEFVTEAALRALVHDCLAEPVAARPTLAEVCYTAMKKLRIVILATVWHFVIENGY